MLIIVQVVFLAFCVLGYVVCSRARQGRVDKVGLLAIVVFSVSLLFFLGGVTPVYVEKKLGESVPFTQLQAGQYVVDRVVTTHGGLAVVRRQEGDNPDQYTLVFVSGIPEDKLGEGTSFFK